MGLESQVKGQFPDAERQYRHALRLDPRHALSCQNLAICYAQMNNLNEAMLTIERAEMSASGLHVTHQGVILTNWAFMLTEAEQTGRALEMAQRAVDTSPNNDTRLVLALCCAAAGEPARAIPVYNAILEADPKHPVAGMNAAFVQTLTDAKPAELLAQRKRWYNGNKQEGTKQPYHDFSSNGRPLRIGYVSGDFKRHSAAFIFGGVLFNHTPRVEVYLYSALPVDPVADTVTKMFMEKAAGVAFGSDNKPVGQGRNRWRDISTMPDDKADELIRQDRIDVLVDLSAHTGGGRLPLFTRRPAPVQVHAWGFAHGTGCPEIDYFFADPIAIPQEEREHYAEKIYDLPCIVTYNPPAEYNLRGISRAPYKTNGYITFGCYSRFEKLSDACLDTFRKVLDAVPDSKLELKDHAFRRPYAIRRVLDKMTGIDPARLLFSISTTHVDHMLAYQQADLILDPYPHSGGVVCMEQLFMGVPVVTLYGTQAAGRTTSSVLTQMGHTDWIARTPEEYVRLAFSMAADPKSLAAHRQTLRKELMESPVIVGYAAAVENAYYKMVEEKAKVTA